MEKAKEIEIDGFYQSFSKTISGIENYLSEAYSPFNYLTGFVISTYVEGLDLVALINKYEKTYKRNMNDFLIPPKDMVGEQEIVAKFVSSFEVIGTTKEVVSFIDVGGNKKVDRKYPITYLQNQPVIV